MYVCRCVYVLFYIFSCTLHLHVSKLYYKEDRTFRRPARTLSLDKEFPVVLEIRPAARGSTLR